MKFVGLDEAQTARGLRLIVAGGVPSPWSQAAMGIFDLAGLDYLAVRFQPVADEVRRWTGAHNAPVALFDDEPPRTGWAEILSLADRLGGTMSLVPRDPEGRVRTFGLINEILGEDGLGWSVRLLLVHASLATDGREGWPLPVARYLAPKYGYAPDRVEYARSRAIAILRHLGDLVSKNCSRGCGYVFGDRPTALDVYIATGMGVIVPMPHDLCPMLPPVRHAFETLDASVRAAVPEILLQHRAMMFDRHLALPVRL